MATNGNNSLPPTEEIINKYKEDLAKQVQADISKKAAKSKERLTKDKVEQYKICHYVKAKETNAKYTNIRFFLSEGTDWEAQFIVDQISGMKSKNEELRTALEMLVGKVKAVKSSMNQAVESACRLDRSVEEEKRCKIDIYNALKEVLGITEEDQNGKLGPIKTATNDNYEKIGLAFDGLVDITGIQTFPDLDSLKGLAENLKKMTADLKKDVDGNASSSGEKMKSTATEVTKVQKDIAVVKFEKSGIVAGLKAKEDQQTFVDSPECGDDPQANLAVIKQACKQIQYEATPPPAPTTNPA